MPPPPLSALLPSHLNIVKVDGIQRRFGEVVQHLVLPRWTLHRRLRRLRCRFVASEIRVSVEQQPSSVPY